VVKVNFLKNEFLVATTRNFNFITAVSLFDVAHIVECITTGVIECLMSSTLSSHELDLRRRVTAIAFSNAV